MRRLDRVLLQASRKAADSWGMRGKAAGGKLPQAVPTCTKVYHPDQTSARIALKHITTKARARSEAADAGVPVSGL